MAPLRCISTPKTIAQVVAATRVARHSTLREFGEKLGVSYQQIKNYEDGTQEPDDKKLTKWFHSKTDWITQMTIEIMVIRYRAMLQIAVAKN